MEALADQAADAMRAAPGFQDVTFFIDPETGECGSFSVWDSRKNMENFVASFGGKLKSLIGDLFLGEPEATYFEVYGREG